MIYCTDNLTAMKLLDADSIDLIYADPPFNTKRDFGSETDGYKDNHTENLTLPLEFEWLDNVVTEADIPYFADKIPRFYEMQRILKKSGALYWHIDHRTAFIYRCILNQIFGRAAFQNEIAWHYQSTFNQKLTKWKNNYDVILFYALKEHKFEVQYKPLTPREIRRDYKYKDGQGRLFRYPRERDLTAYHRRHRVYADDDQGSMVGSCWTDINIATQKERASGYPTQKPLALLDRIIKASSQEGDTVLDPYCGSGTTLLAAKRLKRKYIGFDSNPEATMVAKERCKNGTKRY